MREGQQSLRRAPGIARKAVEKWFWRVSASNRYDEAADTKLGDDISTMGRLAPSEYLAECRDAKLAAALASHLVPDVDDSALMDDDYEGFLEYRAEIILGQIRLLAGELSEVEAEFMSDEGKAIEQNTSRKCRLIRAKSQPGNASCNRKMSFTMKTTLVLFLAVVCVMNAAEAGVVAIAENGTPKCVIVVGPRAGPRPSGTPPMSWRGSSIRSSGRALRLSIRVSPTRATCL